MSKELQKVSPKVSWVVQTLGEQIEKIETTDPRKEPNSLFTYIDVSSVSNRTLQIEETQTIQGVDAPSRARRVVRTGDVIFATVRPTLKRIALIPEVLNGQICSTGYFVIRPKPELDSRFVFYFFQSDTFMDRMKSLQKGASYPAVTDGEIRAQPIPVPPLPEQERIVAILDEAFEGIATATAHAERNLHNARELFQSVLQSTFQQKDKNWVEIALGDVCERLHQGLNTAGQKVKFYDTGYPIIQTRNIDAGRIDLTKKIKLMCKEDWLTYKDRYRPQIGDVFFTNIGTIGKTAVVTIDTDYLIHWNIFKLRPLTNQITSTFLKYILDYLTKSRYFEKRQKGGTVNFVTKKMISEASIHLPDINTQEQEVRKLDALAAETRRLEAIYQRKLDALAELKQSLLQRAFAGEL